VRNIFDFCPIHNCIKTFFFSTDEICHDGLSPFFVAIERRNTEVVKWLVNQRLADLYARVPDNVCRQSGMDTRTIPGDNILHVITRFRDDELLEFIKDHNIDAFQKLMLANNSYRECPHRQSMELFDFFPFRLNNDIGSPINSQRIGLCMSRDGILKIAK
jgi:ankyrin repeat protein